MRSTGDSSRRTRRRARHSASSFPIRPPASKSSWSPGFLRVILKSPMPKTLSAIKDCTKRYEEWLASHVPLIPDDLKLKHTQMKEELFPFMRANYYSLVELLLSRFSDLRSGTD